MSFYFIAVSNASSIISLNVFSLSSELVISGLTKESEIVKIERAFAFYLLAKVYSAAVSISTARTPNSAHFLKYEASSL